MLQGMFGEGEEMTTAGQGFRYFLIEYKKRLPDIDENKDFHEHIDFMIKYFEANGSIYQNRWDDWISENDEKYWRNPTESEKVAIEEKRKAKRKAKEISKEATETRFAITTFSVLLALIGCYGMVSSILWSESIIDYRPWSFYGVLALQGVLMILYEVGMIPFSIWGWLY